MCCIVWCDIKSTFSMRWRSCSASVFSMVRTLWGYGGGATCSIALSIPCFTHDIKIMLCLIFKKLSCKKGLPIGALVLIFILLCVPQYRGLYKMRTNFAMGLKYAIALGKKLFISNFRTISVRETTMEVAISILNPLVHSLHNCLCYPVTTFICLSKYFPLVSSYQFLFEMISFYS